MASDRIWAFTVMDSEEIIRLLSTSTYHKRFQLVDYLSFTNEMIEENERMWREEKLSDDFFARSHMDVDINLDNIEQRGRGELLKASGAKKEADLKGLLKRWISRF